MKRLGAFILFFVLKMMTLTNGDNCIDYKNEYPFLKLIEIKQFQTPYSSYITNTVFRNFHDFNDLILDCNQTYNITRYVEMFPKRALIVDENFQFKKIFNQSQIDQIVHIDIINFNGIDINILSNFIINHL